MPVVEPVVDEDKLRQLLDEGTESPHLDYKDRLDLSQTRDRVELAKDAGAMLAEGGYVVVGADSDGRPTGTLTEAQTALFDESRLRSILRKWLPEPFEMLSRTHIIDGHRMALIYFGPHQDGLGIFKADGQYEHNGQPRTVFRKGDVFVRHGSSSERWTQQDIEQFRRRITEQQREAWLEEIQPLIERIQRGRHAQDLVRATPSVLDYNLDSETFDEIVEQLLRANDYMPVRNYFLRANSEGQRLLGATTEVEAFARLHQRTASIVAAGIVYDQHRVAAEGIETLGEAYTLVGETLAMRSEVQAARAWLDLIAIVEGLGALAVRRQEWSIVRDLTLQQVTYPFHDTYWRVWLRHGLTMAARSNLLDAETEGDRFGPGLIARAHRVAVELPALHPDVAPESDRLLNSICQFDFLACVVAGSRFESDRGRDFYPSFSRYSSGRTEPAARRLLADPSMRQALLGDISDAHLAATLDLINRIAAGQGVQYSGWHGFSEDISRWIHSLDFKPLSEND